MSRVSIRRATTGLLRGVPSRRGGWESRSAGTPPATSGQTASFVHPASPRVGRILDSSRHSQRPARRSHTRLNGSFARRSGGTSCAAGRY